MPCKVCLITGATGVVGQKILQNLVNDKKKVLALGEIAETFDTHIKSSKLKVTTALPVAANAFKKYDVQFCFGDIGDISFLASIFSSAALNDIEIEYVIHIGALVSHSQSSTYKDFGSLANMLEITRAYADSHPEIFKGFFYAAVNKKSADYVEKLKAKGCLNAVVYKNQERGDLGDMKKNKVLYRFVSPFKNSLQSLYQQKKVYETKDHTVMLWAAISNFLENDEQE